MRIEIDREKGGQIVFVLPGGGALGTCQAGVRRRLTHKVITKNWRELQAAHGREQFSTLQSSLRFAAGRRGALSYQVADGTPSWIGFVQIQRLRFNHSKAER